MHLGDGLKLTSTDMLDYGISMVNGNSCPFKGESHGMLTSEILTVWIIEA